MGKLDHLKKSPRSAQDAPALPAPQKPIRAVKTLKEQLTCRCGHKVGVAHFESALCPECVGKARPKNVDHNRVPKQGRLPDGAVFEVHYDAGTETWAGALVIGPTVFQDTASGVFRLLRTLDAQYRKVAHAASQ